MNIKELLQNRSQAPTSPVNKRLNERSDLIRQFVERLNMERLGTKYKKLKPSAVAVKISHLSLSELYYFYKLCDNSRSGFSKCFWGCLKVK